MATTVQAYIFPVPFQVLGPMERPQQKNFPVMYLPNKKIYVNQTGMFFADGFPNPMVVDWLKDDHYLITLPKGLADSIFEATYRVVKAKAETTEINILLSVTKELNLKLGEGSVVATRETKDSGSSLPEELFTVGDKAVDNEGVYEVSTGALAEKGFNKSEFFYINQELANRIDKAVSLCSQAKKNKESVLKVIKERGFFELKHHSACKVVNNIENRKIVPFTKFVVGGLALIFGIFAMMILCAPNSQNREILEG